LEAKSESDLRPVFAGKKFSGEQVRQPVSALKMENGSKSPARIYNF